MKKFSFKILLLATLVCFGKKCVSQVDKIPYYNNLVFNNSFSLVAEKDLKNNFYVIDLSDFKSEFEKSFFIDLAFRESRLVRLDVGNWSAAWYKSSSTYSEKEIHALFQKLRSESMHAAATWTKEKRSEWLTKNAK